jgi:anti-sigma factor RsiW
MTELSDELLVAYVDGQLAREQVRAVEKVLAQDDVVARRVAALQESHTRLEAAFEAILASEMSEVTSAQRLVVPEWQEVEQPRWRTKLGWMGWGLVAGLVVAVVAIDSPLKLPTLAGMREALLPARVEQPIRTWQEDAARAQGLLTRASLEVGLESQANRDFVAFQLAEAIGPEVKLPNLEPQGFRFVRAQILRYGDQPLAQVLYLPAKRDPLALYAREGHRDSPPIFRQEGDIDTVFWCADGIAYLLAGREDQATLYRIAEKIRNEPLPVRPEPPRTPTLGAVAAPSVPAAPLPPPHVSDTPPPAPAPDASPQTAVPIPSRPH